MCKPQRGKVPNIKQLLANSKQQTAANLETAFRFHVLHSSRAVEADMQMWSKRKQNEIVLCEYIGVKVNKPAEALGRCEERGIIMSD